ncbi:preprotein translocase subunit SecG [Sphingomonas montanisoli]|uniref:Protein-export membrane protein SecG n=1 Tax=Sphingomonas montanisoli TaxID=2606412 RepID=A0A5D9C0I7_9SPHN|nr:preprotein translocase subunit SecG [Sphingomonas montanisoli]TZG24943.1 preprotein translocase subunit SecG [Sphingomonas montanisoli]
MLTFLLVVHAIIAAALVAVILMQRSEGGGLTSGSNAGGLMSARGAADFMTRATTILATLFVLLSIGLAALASVTHGPSEIDTSLVGKTATTQQPAPAPVTADPLAAAAAQGSEAPAANGAAPAN